MKFVATVLLALLMLNSFFYCLYCNICIWQREAEVKEMLASENFDCEITLVKISASFTGSELATKDELWYNKSLYDVIKRQVVKDTLYVYMIADGEEEAFVDKIDSYISAGNEHCYNENCTVHTEKHTVKNISQDYTCPPFPCSFLRRVDIKHLSVAEAFTPLAGDEIIKPPPHFSCLVILMI